MNNLKTFTSRAVKSRRKDLRKSSTTAEKIIWNHLKNRQYLNLKFRRQFSIGKFIADFYCPELQLAIEIDGANHFFDDKSTAYDVVRQEFIESHGIKVLRFTNTDVLENINGVLESIGGYVSSHVQNLPSPLLPPEADAVERRGIKREIKNPVLSSVADGNYFLR